MAEGPCHFLMLLLIPEVLPADNIVGTPLPFIKEGVGPPKN